MATLAFEGKCSAKSTYNGDPIGTDFLSEQVNFGSNLFSAFADNDESFVQIAYAGDLSPGTHELSFKPESGTGPALQYRVGGRTFQISGTGTVTIGTNPVSQEGTFKGTYLGDFGLTVFEGSFKAEYRG
ncbi:MULTISPECIES: hypothetical protein [unclassified Pseudomonas]|uniref:hypothetical protein n=1 Tax=unclassified Pseudomonas TaxID=196821 RepID=UPI00111C0FC2|nr:MULTISPECIES: hypothetical protein [unclassified Pseudomonas]